MGLGSKVQQIETAIISIMLTFIYLYIVYQAGDNAFIGVFNNIDGSIYATRVIDIAVSLAGYLALRHWLIPHFLRKRFYTQFAVVAILAVALLSLVEWLGDQALISYFDLPATQQTYLEQHNITSRNSYDFTVVPGNIAIFILFMAYCLSRDWVNSMNNQHRLTEQKLQAEIDMLRAQLNPHFLFNVLNNIFAITQRNDDQEAGDAIIKLSTLMRYMLYDSNVPLIDLTQEINYIHNYIDLAKLKFGKNDPAKIEVNVQGAPTHWQVPPLLFIGLIENGFKHGFNSKGEGHLVINIVISDKKLMIGIENSQNSVKSSDGSGGIGLVNIEKRLAIHFPQRYNLELGENAGCYHALLEINR